MSIAMKSVWEEYHKTGSTASAAIRDIIKSSWDRCKQLGISPFLHTAPVVINDKDLVTRRWNNRELLSTGIPVMEYVYDIVRGSGFIISLVDKEGYVLKIVGDHDVTDVAAKKHFVVGSNWSEGLTGTNAVGLSLKLNIPVQVVGSEHYCVSWHKWTCSAATVHDPEGNLIGVLNAAGSCETPHSHTLGMVVAAAKTIEKELSFHQSLNHSQTADHYKNMILECISEGILFCNPRGIISHVNEATTKLLGEKRHNILGKRVCDIFGEENAKILNIIFRGTEVNGCEIELSTPSGKRLACEITCRPITDDSNKHEGTLVIISEKGRAKRSLPRMIGAEAAVTFADLVGSSKEFANTVALGKSVAASNSNVLLLGESGTGKDMFAQAIHNASGRRKGPFVAINCGAMPKELIGSELFGYTDGAFTGAKRGGTPGKFELADGGTIFLDEIGEMPLDLQITLLRVLEQKTVVRIGGQEVIPVDVRLIAATNKNLLSEIKKGTFREDLYYRLNVISITMSPLRERKEDILPLARHFLGKLCRQLGKQISCISPDVDEILRGYNWPGNVRELQNVIERAVNIATGPVLTADLLPHELYGIKKQCNILPLAQHEHETFQKLMAKFGGNISRVAKELGIARTTVYRKINKYGIKSEYDLN